MAAINSLEQMTLEAARIKKEEHLLGKDLLQPNTFSVSGSRKLLFSTQLDQKLPLLNPEPPLVQTGYENQLGMLSSSFLTADADYMILKKILKYSFTPDHYYLITKNAETNEIGIIERRSYTHNTESYGYLNNCSFIDSLEEGSGIIPKGTVYQKSTAFDEYNNRQDGVNLLTLHLANDKVKEDGIVVSKSAARKLASPFFKKVTIMVNDNDIPLNLYGDDNYYKFLPNIGESTKNGLLCGIRREKKDECLYTQSAHMLRNSIASDTNFTVSGTVIDIDIACNNLEKMENEYMGQLRMYYDEYRRFASELTRFVGGYVKSGYKLSYELQKMYRKCMDVLAGKQFIKDNKLFSCIIIEVTLMTQSVIEVGDKLTDRYGGKGVVSEIREDYLMPILDDGSVVEIIYDQYTPVNRGNPAQLMEISLNFIASRLLEYANNQIFDAADFIEMYLKFIRILSPKFASYVEEVISPMTDEDTMLFINSMIESGMYLSLEPVSEAVDLDKLEQIYDAFPFIKKYIASMPIVNSNGEIRYAPALRQVIAGKKYIYRLKQYAEDKFSVTSLSPTNIRGENCKSRSSKEYRTPYSKTPIQFGNMETGDLAHMGMDTVILNMMIYSVSPTTRRSCERMLTENPFTINIDLNEDASNRSAEIFNAYFKAMGYRLDFIKRPKGSSHPVMCMPIEMTATMENPISRCHPIQMCDPNDNIMHRDDGETIAEYLARVVEESKGYKRPIMLCPINVIPVMEGKDD